jgi:hypothetical protein
MTLPEQIRAWVAREFNAKYVDQITADLVDVATGYREGNRFEKAALPKIMAARQWRDSGEGPFPSRLSAKTFATAEVAGPWRVDARSDGYYVRVFVEPDGCPG